MAAAAGKWSYVLSINAAALIASRFLFSGFEIHGVLAFIAAAAAIELPTIAWLLAAHLWTEIALKPAWAARPSVARTVWLRTSLIAYVAVALALTTAAPGLAVAASITSLTITDTWTFIGASAITAVVTILLAPRPLETAWRLALSFGRKEAKERNESGSGNRAGGRSVVGRTVSVAVLAAAAVSATHRGGGTISLAVLFGLIALGVSVAIVLDVAAHAKANPKSRESDSEQLGRLLRDALLQVWLPHRNAVRFAQAVLALVALVAGGVAVGEVFGAVLALGVVLVPRAVLWLLVRSKREDLRSRANQ